jgi:hypothetical protein
MKKLLIIAGLIIFAALHAVAQDDAGGDEKIRDRMREFIQKRMNLSRSEAERFTPVFIRYFREWRQTLRDHRDDGPMRQLKIAELRIRYRTEFRDIVGEKRSNEIYRQQEIFIDELQKIRQERIKRDDRPNKRFRALNQ